MADYLTTDTELTSVANAIRTKGGTSASLVYPTGFVTAIQNLPSGGTDVSDTTAVEADVRTGKYFHKADGSKVQGSIADQAAQTIHPSTTDQTIASGKYLTGTQTVKGVLLTNLTAGNIKKDVVVKIGDSTDDDCVTSVTGTYEGGGGGNIKRITGNGSRTVNVSGWGTSDFTTNTNVIDANDPKFTVLHITIGNNVRTYAPTKFNNSTLTFAGSINESYYSGAIDAVITQTGGYIRTITLPGSVSGYTVYAWEIISNLPVQEEPSSGSFYIDAGGNVVECFFDAETPTWVEWIQSDYNSEIGLEEEDGYLTVSGMYLYYDEYTENPVTVSDAITANTTYYLI